MMGRLKRDQGQFFYSFRLEEVVPADHRVREIADVLDLSWVHAEPLPWHSCAGGGAVQSIRCGRMAERATRVSPASRRKAAGPRPRVRPPLPMRATLC